MLFRDINDCLYFITIIISGLPMNPYCDLDLDQAVSNVKIVIC